MASKRIDKVLLSNEGALKLKYGANYQSVIQPAIQALIAADMARGINTIYVPLDDTTMMAGYKAKPVTKSSDQRQNKRAIDGIYQSLSPAYICIVGSVDVIPHQHLVNPMKGDGDPDVPSDLPYACNRGYSKQIQNFLQPIRVVGRLPDITGGSNANYLADLLSVSAQAQSHPSTHYTNYFGITAQVWQASTQLSLTTLFGNNTALQIVPPGGPPWTTGQLQNLSHFINCHGAPADSRFYGQSGNSFPIAHDAARLNGLQTGTVASVECCYGTELYNPILNGGQMGLCNAYLEKKAYAFFGSSTIAYGPATGNGQADLICQFFLKHILAGESTGAAALQARLDYIKAMSVITPSDLKTLAQFNLMGDPSIYPVLAPTQGDVLVEAGTAKTFANAKQNTDLGQVRASSRNQRRKHFASLGTLLGSSVAKVNVTSKQPSSNDITQLLETELTKQNASPIEVSTFTVDSPKFPGAKAMQAREEANNAEEVNHIHVAIGELPQAEATFKRFYVVTASQQDGQLVLQYLYSR